MLFTLQPQGWQQWFSVLRKLDTRLWNAESGDHSLSYLMILLQEKTAPGDNFTSLQPSKLCMCATITIPNLHADPGRVCKRVWEKWFSTFNHREIEWGWTTAWASQIRCLWQASIVMCVDHQAGFFFFFVSFMVSIKFMSYIFAYLSPNLLNLLYIFLCKSSSHFYIPVILLLPGIFTVSLTQHKEYSSTI